MPTNCSAVIAILDAHFNSHIQQRRADSRRFVSFHGGNGVGDEVNGFLLSLVASLVRGRRLEIAPQSTSYLSAFEPPFDLNYTGPLDALPQKTGLATSGGQMTRWRAGSFRACDV